MVNRLREQGEVGIKGFSTVGQEKQVGLVDLWIGRTRGGSELLYFLISPGFNRKLRRCPMKSFRLPVVGASFSFRGEVALAKASYEDIFRVSFLTSAAINSR